MSPGHRVQAQHTAYLWGRVTWLLQGWAFSGGQAGTVGTEGRWNRKAQQMTSQGSLEVSGVTSEERPCPGRHKERKEEGRCFRVSLALPGEPRPHLSCLKPSPQPHSCPAHCTSPGPLVPKRSSHSSGHRPPPPPSSVPSWQTGKQVWAVCFTHTSPDRRLLVGPPSEPCASSGPTKSCFNAILRKQSGSPGPRADLCSFAFLEAGLTVCPVENTFFFFLFFFSLFIHFERERENGS